MTSNIELVEKAEALSDLRFSRDFHYDRRFEDMVAQGRAWSEFEALCRDHPDKTAVAAARKAEIERMFMWEQLYNDHTLLSQSLVLPLTPTLSP